MMNKNGGLGGPSAVWMLDRNTGRKSIVHTHWRKVQLLAKAANTLPKGARNG